MSETRKTLKDFLRNNNISDQTRISYSHDTADGVIRDKNELGKEPGLDKELLDLDAEGIGLLGDYLSYIIEEANNDFKIAPGNERAAPSGRGEDLVLAEEQGAEDVFVRQGSPEYSEFSSKSNSGRLENSDINLKDIVDKTGKESNAHRLLKSIPGTSLDKTGKTDAKRNNPTNNKIIKASSQMLLNSNRFANVTNSQAFNDRNTSNEEFDSIENKAGTISLQNIYSEFDVNAKNTSFDNLKQIASSLILKASGFDTGDTPGNSAIIEELEQEIKKGEASNSILNDSGFFNKFVNDLRAKNAKGFPEGEQGNSYRDGRGDLVILDPEAKNSKSHGTLFNNVMRFSSSNSKMLRIQTSLVVTGLVKSINDLIDSILPIIEFKNEKLKLDTESPKVVQKDAAYIGRGPLKLGEHLPNLNNNLHYIKILVLVDTIYPYKNCVEAGLKVLFGKENKDPEKVKKYSHISQAPGFWLSVASSALKSASNIFDATEDILSEDFDSGSVQDIIKLFGNSSLIKFANVAATIGDIFLQSTGGRENIDSIKNISRIYDVDDLPDGPATRVMKSRSKGGDNELSLAWKQGSVPSMYLLPSNIINAVVDLNTLVIGQNPINGMLGSGLVKETFIDPFFNKSYNRIPNHVVKQLEDKLDAEYVPFYLQDLRTNEIISFHAFLDTLTDSINPNFTSVDGYGRLDSVKIYNKTTRTVTVSFKLIATSKEDYNEMWYKINKLTTLLYPQWTQGSVVSNQFDTLFPITSTFVQPFSQVLGATPLVRLRVGDVIKSNYSRFNLARVFGIGDLGINAIPADEEGFGSTVYNVAKNIKGAAQSILLKERSVAGVSFALRDVLLGFFYAEFGGPLGAIDVAENKAANISFLGRTPLARLGFSIARNSLSSGRINGYVNPKGAAEVIRQLSDPNEDQNNLNGTSGGKDIASETLQSSLNSIRRDAGSSGVGFPEGSIHLIKSSPRKYLCKDDGHEYKIDRNLRVLIKAKPNPKNTVELSKRINKDSVFNEYKRSDFYAKRGAYEIQVIDLAAPKGLYQKVLFAYHTDILPNPSQIFKQTKGYSGLRIPAIASSFGGLLKEEGSMTDSTKGATREADINSGKGTAQSDLLRSIWASSANGFMDPSRNPITRAYETTSGRGLAGTLGNIQFNWLEGLGGWEVDWNSRAPKGVSISLTLDVIHDIPPGLDHSGYNRAPLYNVGDIMRHVAGDPYEDNGEVSEHLYKKAGSVVNRKTKGEN